MRSARLDAPGRPRPTSIRILSLLLLLAPAVASAAEGVFEINQTCAVQTGCFGGDAPGLPVTLSTRGSYRLTSVLSFNSVFGPLSSSFIEITGQDVDLDLNGFGLRCSNVLTGDPCTGTTAAGVSLTGVARKVRIHDGSISGMPGDGVFGVNSSQIQLENLRVSESGRNGLQANTGSRIEGCTVVDSAQQGIVAGTDSIVSRNVVQNSGGIQGAGNYCGATLGCP